ncbi:hypothetical protein Tco_1502106 [Tanacetum coccineum]
MAASAIAISSDSSDESVGSPPSQVILFGDIPIVIPSTSVVVPETFTIAPVISSAAPVVEMTLVASPTGLCGLVPYSDSDSDSPDEMSSPEHISPLPSILPFLCTNSSEAPDFSDGPPSQDPYVMAVARWRSKSAITIRPGEAILFGRPYRTHLNGPHKLLTARKIVGPIPACRLAWRRVSPRSSDHRPSSSSSSSDSLPVHSSGLDAPDQAHSGSSIRDYSSERPLRSSLHSARPSRKRCRSSVDSIPSFMPVMGSLAPTRTDLLPPCKRFRDSYSFEASVEEDTEIDPIETEVDMELGISDRDDVRDHVEIDPRDVRDDTEEYEADTSAGDTVEVGIDPMSALIVKEEIVEPVGEDPSDSSGIRDGIVRSFEDMPINLDDVVRGFYHHMSEVRIDRIIGIETAQRRLKDDQLIAKGQRVSMIERIDRLRLENLKVHAILDIERDRVNNLRLSREGKYRRRGGRMKWQSASVHRYKPPWATSEKWGGEARSTDSERREWESKKEEREREKGKQKGEDKVRGGGGGGEKKVCKRGIREKRKKEEVEDKEGNVKKRRRRRRVMEKKEEDERKCGGKEGEQGGSAEREEGEEERKKGEVGEEKVGFEERGWTEEKEEDGKKGSTKKFRRKGEKVERKKKGREVKRERKQPASEREKQGARGKRRKVRETKASKEREEKRWGREKGRKREWRRDGDSRRWRVMRGERTRSTKGRSEGESGEVNAGKGTPRNPREESKKKGGRKWRKEEGKEVREGQEENGNGKRRHVRGREEEKEVGPGGTTVVSQEDTKVRGVKGNGGEEE